MAPPSNAERNRKQEYFEILDETLRTNPYRKAATAMASVMNKHGITSDASNVLGKPSSGLPEKKCALTRSLRLAQNCNQKLNITKDELQALCCDLGIETLERFAEEAGNQAKSDTATVVENPSDRAVMTGHLLTLIGEAQTIAKRIYETAVGLHVAEDYLRQPEDLKLLDFSACGRIQIPNYNFNHASQLCLEWLHSTAIKWLRGFKEDGGDENIQFIKVFENFTKAVKDYTEAVCLANQVFRVLLYPNTYGKETLKDWVLSLGHVLKNDIMMEIQSLRRAFDSIQYSFERLGWAASIAWMKYSGKNITVETLNKHGIQVDHSIFHHKFYEGPSKLKKKSKTDTNGNPENSTKMAKNEQDTPSDSEPPTVPSRSKTYTPADDRREKTAGNGEIARNTGEAEDYTDPVPVSRSSRSTPDVSKARIPKKPLKKKGKAEQLDRPGTVKGLPSETILPAENSNIALGLLKVLRSGKAYSMANSQSTIDSTDKVKSKATPLTPAPIIPPAWRKQFGAVFGEHLVPPKGKAPKKPRKKASVVPGTSQSQKQSNKKVGAQ